MIVSHPVGALADVVADHLAVPDRVSDQFAARPWWRHSLAHGAPGIALLHIERAAIGLAPWQRAHDWLTYAARGPVTAGTDSHLYYGAPAVAHALACAALCNPGTYRRALDSLDQQIADDVQRRVQAAHARIDSGRLPALAEFDVIRGLSGIGSYLLRRVPGSPALRAVLGYLIRLSNPIAVGGRLLPGWWVDSGPSGRASGRFIGGHGNLGVAHGVGGVLALLALAARNGVLVDGQAEAIDRICSWLDQWRADTSTGPVWPFWVNRSQHEAGHRDTSSPQRLGWCYGTVGLARAQQLAAIATGNSERQAMAENALVQALSNPAHRAVTSGASLCHGNAGLVRLIAVAAADAAPGTAARLRALIPELLDSVHPAGSDPQETAASLLHDPQYGPAFLEGASGVALAVLPHITGHDVLSGWDSCLLVT